MPPPIRLATSHDIAIIQETVRTAYARFVARIGREPGPMHDNYASMVKKGWVYVAEHEGAVRGILVLIPEGHVMLLDNVAVLPEAQGLGIGRLLLAFAERAAVNAGCHAIRLYTNEAMTENIALYTRIGYSETHRAEEKGLRRVYMRKAL
jgi:ribosomal protein S18 acetylase RimI-like enzyme